MPVFLDPFRRAFHRLGREPAAMDAAVFSSLDELGAFEHAQVFGHGRERHVVWGCKIADGRFALREPREDAAARRVGKRCKGVIQQG